MVDKSIGVFKNAIEAGVKAAANIDTGPIKDPYMPFVFDTSDGQQQITVDSPDNNTYFYWGIHDWESDTYIVTD